MKITGRSHLNHGWAYGHCGKCSLALLDYIAKLGIFPVGVPYLFGLYFTALGLLTNFLLIDYFVYRSYKFKINQMWGDKDE